MLTYNPRYEEMWTAKVGPHNPMITEFHQAPKNNLAGYVEKAAVSDFNFDVQRKTFMSYGYAIDPSANRTGDALVGNVPVEGNAVTVFEKVWLRKLYFSN